MLFVSQTETLEVLKEGNALIIRNKASGVEAKAEAKGTDIVFTTKAGNLIPFTDQPSGCKYRATTK